MASSSTITVRMDPEIKRRTESIFEEIGLSWTAAFTVFAKAVIREHRIPFELKAKIPEQYYDEDWYLSDECAELTDRVKNGTFRSHGLIGERA
jgi:DNA-damage-inducible protein J